MIISVSYRTNASWALPTGDVVDTREYTVTYVRPGESMLRTRIVTARDADDAERIVSRLIQRGIA